MTNERIKACLILAAVGDAIGYKNGSWEFNFHGSDIHEQCKELGGISNIDIDGWSVSDDTIMHIATCKALITPYSTFDELMSNMAKEYIACWSEMGGRAPGGTCGSGVYALKSVNWNQLPYDKFGGGCGGSMRSMGIGLKFYGEKNRDMLIACSIEAGRLTHNHPTGFLGSMVSSVFTAFAMEGIPVKQWGNLLTTQILPMCRVYLEKCQRDWKEIDEDMKLFEEKWAKYLKTRGIEDGTTEPTFPTDYGVEERDEFYKIWSYRGWAGASGDDSVIIAYFSMDSHLLVMMHCLDVEESGSS